MVRLTPTWKKLALSAGSALVTVTALELGFRAALRASFEKSVANFSHVLYRAAPDHEFLYTLHPSVERENEIPRAPGAKWSYSIDGAGHRVTDQAASAQAERRVVCIGDSYTFGWAVNDAETFPSALARRLRARASEAAPHVVNAGVPGYNTFQEAAFLKHFWASLAPDVVVLGFVMNDAEPTRVLSQAPDVRYREAGLWLLEDLKLKLGLADGPLRSRLQRFRGFAEQFEPGAPERALCYEGLASIARTCREHETPLLIAVFPGTPRLVESGYPYTSIHAQVVAWGAELGVPTLDLLPCFLDDHSADVCVPGDGHPNAAALERFAAPIAAALEDYL